MPEVKETDLLKIDRDIKNVFVLAAFGEFIATFARVEASLQVLLRNSTGTAEAKARLLCKDVRTSSLTKKIKALRGIPEKPIEREHVRLSEIFKQFNWINEMRDFLAHRASIIAPTMMITLDWLTSKALPSDRETAMSSVNAYSVPTLLAA